ncbi:unnamed protein product [Durusdinium trenchii]|uniref:Cytosol aminopeptidase domain-containing protein n=1 Tax=Durusdinium trenchii TaxID=1381693 RepID=A0ABP0IP82_9DINO
MCDTLVLLLPGEGDDNIPILSTVAKSIDEALGGAIGSYIKEESFEAKAGAAAMFPVFGKAVKRVVLVGLGDKEPSREAGAAIGGAIKRLKGGSVGVAHAEGVEAQALVEGLLLGLHADKRFQGTKTPEKDKAPKGPEKVEMLGYSSAEDIEKAGAIAAGVVFARELVNAPANIVDPLNLTAAAADMAQRLGLSSKILDEKECEAMGMGSFLAVSRASNLGARLIHLTYSPGGEVKRKLGIVGKGLTFDSGGYNLKGAGSMIELMKFDMGGSASTLGAAAAIAQLKPKDVEVHFVIATCENMVSGNSGALRPGDIITAMDGTTIEAIWAYLGAEAKTKTKEEIDETRKVRNAETNAQLCHEASLAHSLVQAATSFGSYANVTEERPGHRGSRNKKNNNNNNNQAEDDLRKMDASLLRDELDQVKYNHFRRFDQVFFVVEVQIVVAIISAALSRGVRWYLSPKRDGGKWTAEWTPRRSNADAEDRSRTLTIPLDVDIYGAAVSSCIRDMQVLALGSHQNADESIRAFRIVASLLMLWTCIFVQGFVSYMAASQLSSDVILKFRRLYDSYELMVYRGDSLQLTPNGFHRGQPAGYRPAGFAYLSEDKMHEICQMPLANDLFLLVVLLIWTLSCVVDLRRAICMLMDFTITLPTNPLKDSTIVAEAVDGEDGDVTIVGIPVGMRIFLTLAVFLPRLILDAVILYLGCRWLVATSDMGDLILNAVALEFVLVLNSLVCQALVPVHGVNGLERTKVLSTSSRHDSAMMALGVNNTDAEGRLTLADALLYCQQQGVTEVIDIATLTGACMVALGKDITGMWSNSDELAASLDAASKSTDEKLWRMPLEDGYFEGLKSDFADMKNTGPRFGGAITAALFLQKFIQKEVNWAHLDIAGPAWAEKAKGIYGVGGTGAMVRTLTNFACKA